MERVPLARGLEGRVGLEASGVLSTGLPKALCIICEVDNPGDSCHSSATVALLLEH